MDVKRDYYEDIQLLESKAVLLWSTAFLIFTFLPCPFTFTFPNITFIC